jgi:maleamate amidohydrolase
MASWRDIMSGEDYSSFDTSQTEFAGIGTRPALLVIDVVKAFLGEKGLSREEGIAGWPLSCGPVGWAAMPRVKALIDMAREHDFPVIFTVGDSHVLGGATRRVVDARAVARAEVAEIPDEIAPLPTEKVIAKGRASAFFGTPLAALLVKNAIDSLIVCGTTTSGCVRATVVDGHSYGWPVVIADDASFDRAQLSHDVSLFEMNAKYARVASTSDIIGAAVARAGDRRSE